MLETDVIDAEKFIDQRYDIMAEIYQRSVERVEEKFDNANHVFSSKFYVKKTKNCDEYY